MPLPFSKVVNLYQDLEKIERRDPPLLPQPKAEALRVVTERWFRSNRNTINGLDVRSGVALLSSLLPERRTDRVYSLQPPSLCRILGRTLGLNAVRRGDLEAHKQANRGDLGQCLERVLKTHGPPARPATTLEEVDDMLEALAAQCRISDKSIRISFPPASSEPKDKLLGDVVKRVSPEEGKWLVRLVLKDFAPVKIPEEIVLKQFHFLLPDLLRFQDNFNAALGLLKNESLLRQLPDCPDPRSARLHKLGAATVIRPQVGVKVGRPTFIKARSLDSCVKMLGSQEWVLERKYDGEYCEIHVDLSKSMLPMECIQIFSKSGKDSTDDRKGLHQTLVNCLRLGKLDCKIKKQAIILGELVVYSDESKSTLSFDKIRNHVSRSGVFLGNEQDSQRHAYEHLAIVFFDLLLLDDEVVMTKGIEERRRWLHELYRKIRGRAMSAEWKIVDFASTDKAMNHLMEQFAASNVMRCEGLILKPCGSPYFPLDTSPSEQRHFYIKLKKDYIEGMGDEADFAVVGASYNAQQAHKSGIRNIKWTDFHLGCMINAVEVRRFDANPVFKIVGTIQQEACIPKPILETLNTLGHLQAKPYGEPFEHFSLQDTKVKIDVLFSTPFVLEVLGSGFNKPSNCDYYMLRHARVKKLHQDRSWRACVSFEELQDQARKANDVPATDECKKAETLARYHHMELKLKRRLEREGSVTPRSRRSTPPAARASCTRQLEGSTLVQVCSSGSKRASPTTDDTPCPEAKIRRPSDDRDATTPQPRITPLSDITNQALGREVSLDNVLPVRAPVTKQRCQVAKPAISNAACSGTQCPFNNTAVLLAPCIANALYITEDLLPSHQSHITARLEHWDRDSFAHPPGRETVAESQACEGMRKVVLVEGKRQGAVEMVIDEIMALNQGRMRQRVELLDWRVLEECCRHDRTADTLKRHFIGATMFVEAEGRAIFVSNIPGLGHN
ncbi:hypothetical protein LTR56_008738 [Elasticomyces elasticus]|nr:hypothetical protein LTR22_017523 [Elasticomyces elasticus]KAK3646120.1 hypothetical protein LTR56_008738 [Elasticomyces elasticus]KAK4924301.1 hypothetical protein LTR49_008602 [Elasticomyces elasticus]KAK5759141.1 hypothetical protein LTS12_010749 [Elasticomyces elasticus]